MSDERERQICMKGQMKKKIHFEMIAKDKSELSSDIYKVQRIQNAEREAEGCGW